MRALADEAGINFTRISRLENDLVAPSEEEVERLARALGGDPSEVREWAGFPVAPFARFQVENPRLAAQLINATWAALAERLRVAGVGEEVIPELVAQLDPDQIIELISGQESLITRTVETAKEADRVAREAGEQDVLLFDPKRGKLVRRASPWHTVYKSSDFLLRVRGDLTETQEFQMQLIGQLIRTILDGRSNER